MQYQQELFNNLSNYNVRTAGKDWKLDYTQWLSYYNNKHHDGFGITKLIDWYGFRLTNMIVI